MKVKSWLLAVLVATTLCLGSVAIAGRTITLDTTATVIDRCGMLCKEGSTWTATAFCYPRQADGGGAGAGGADTPTQVTATGSNPTNAVTSLVSACTALAQ